MRPLRTLFAAGLLGFALIGATAGGALAYGKADQPLAQIELSANCNNATFGLCQGQTGGVWLWIEIDSANGQTADIAGAGCGHIKGVGGGADSIRGEIDWTYSDTAQGLPGIFFAPDPVGYYNIVLQGPNGPETFSFPVTVGHYSTHPAPGVAIELQVAP
jgi:hypothetical protein